MPVLDLSPPPDQIRALGPLAYVDDAERRRIMAMPAGRRDAHLRQLQRDVDRAQQSEDDAVRELEDRVRTAPRSGPRAPMTDLQKKWADRLQHVRLPLQSKDGPFIQTMREHPAITERQALYLAALIRKYRRQL